MVGDFETTVYEGQTYTEVWASAVVELGSEDVKIHHSIRETYNYLYNLRQNICIYYHNLKFDGSFWLSFLLTDLKYEQKLTQQYLQGTLNFDKDLQGINQELDKRIFDSI